MTHIPEIKPFRYFWVMFVFWSFAFISQGFSQEPPTMIWVEFRDKDNSPYSLSQPEKFLSVRALERRQKQSIPLDFYDLPVSPGYVETILSDTTITLYYTSRWFNGAMLRLEHVSSLDKIKDYDFVLRWENVKPKINVKKEKDTLNNSLQGIGLSTSEFDFVRLLEGFSAGFPYSVSNYYYDYPAYGKAGSQIKLVNAQALHQKGFWGNDLHIALLDAGYRGVDTLEGFDFLWSRNQILGFRDFVNPDGAIFSAHPHGTYVLSVMAGYLPGQFSGASLGASYWLLRTEDASTEFRIEEYNWLAGAEYADSVGADIINSSLGYTRFDDPDQNYMYEQLDGHTTVVARAANMAADRGILVVNSAGNYGTQNWRYIGSPADAFGALAVGGTDSLGNRIAFSSVGPSSDGRVKPDIMAQAFAVAAISHMGTIVNANGTSFSAPLISAAAACLWEKFPTASARQIREAITKSADRYLKPDTLYGYGIPDFEMAAAVLMRDFTQQKYITLTSNPLVPQSAITFYAHQEDVISIDLFNSSGLRMWSKKNIAVVRGYNKIKPFKYIDTFSSGMYLIRVNFSSHSQLVKAIKF